MKKTVYIIGATEGFSKLNLPDFNVIEGFLDKRDFDSVKPHDLFDQMDNNILSHQEQMQRRFNAIEECDMCIVMPNHHLCSYARAEVYHARHMEMEVVSFIDWNVVMHRKAELRLAESVTTKRGTLRISQVA